MKKIYLCFIMLFLSIMTLTSCGSNKNSDINYDVKTNIKITFNDQVLYAEFYENETANAILNKFPLEITMQNLYNREMCYRFDDELPTENVINRGYAVGEIIYYPPMHSFVIMYEQNDEHFSMQSVGKITSGDVSMFKSTGDIKMKFEIEKNDEVEKNRLKIEANGNEFIATLVDNSSTQALKKLIANNGGSIIVNMSDYGNMEKVGSLGASLPRNDQQISTSAGDLILYQGSSFVIYYDHNNWSLTRLGKIDGATKESLLAAFGNGNVTVKLSLTK